MSKKYPGGIIRGTPVVPAGPFQNSAAPGIWTLEQATNYIRQGIWPTAGNINPDLFIENLFSTWLYTGNGSTQTINNGIDLAGKGGLVWSKCRSSTLGGNGIHMLIDTARGVGNRISSDLTGAQAFNSNTITAFNAGGFAIGNSPINNTSAETFVSWTFREQPRFFDIVTYTGNGANRTIAHSLGSVPGCIMVKRLDASADWQVYHRSLANTQYMVLNSIAAAATGATRWNSTTPTATEFSLGTDATVNASGGTYVAYLFAHNAGGFGATGADNVISCGSFTTDSFGNATVNLGYEPQWVLMKLTATTGNWLLFDNMRGMTTNSTPYLLAESTAAETTNSTIAVQPTATGFDIRFGNTSSTPIYIAIRRGPMRTPTSGTSVFSPIASSAATGTALTTGFPVDMQINARRNVTTEKNYAYDRLRGISSNTTESGQRLVTQSTQAEDSYAATRFWGNTGFQMPSINNTTSSIYWNFRRAPGFFDVVCWTGDSTNPRSISHNLTVAPTLIITKKRNSTSNWITGFDFASTTYKYFNLNDTGAATSDTYVSSPVYGGNPTSSVFIVGNQGNMNISGDTYVSYLFASCPSVSRVGTYTGTGATQTIDCGFSAGARFVLIKRTDSTGDWYVWDSARGIVAGNDPYLLLNSTAAEVTNTDWVDTAASGFELSSAAGNLVNTNGASYIFLSVS